MSTLTPTLDRPIVRPPAADPTCGLAPTAAAVVDYLADMVPMGCWAVTRIRDDRQVPVAVRVHAGQAPSPECGAGEWAATFAYRAVTGSAPSVAPDAMSIDAYARAAAENGTTVGAIVAVPVRVDGELTAVLVGIDAEPQEPGLAEYLPLFHLLSELLAHAARYGSGSFPAPAPTGLPEPFSPPASGTPAAGAVGARSL